MYVHVTQAVQNYTQTVHLFIIACLRHTQNNIVQQRVIHHVFCTLFLPLSFAPIPTTNSYGQLVFGGVLFSYANVKWFDDCLVSKHEIVNFVYLASTYLQYVYS